MATQAQEEKWEVKYFYHPTFSLPREPWLNELALEPHLVFFAVPDFIEL